MLLTGGTKGIGLAIARKFVSQGFDLVTCSRSGERLKNLKEELKRLNPNTIVYTLVADLEKKEEVVKFIDYFLSLNRPADVLINNAGIFLPGKIMDEPEENLSKLMSLNVFSAYFITRAVAAQMKKEGKGHIFNICSIASITAYSSGASYGISKYALYGMTRILRQELKKFNIRVTAVLPGATLTDSWVGTDLPPERFMKPEDVAESVYNAWSLSDSSVVEEIILRPQLGDL